jgi:adenylate cyclase
MTFHLLRRKISTIKQAALDIQDDPDTVLQNQLLFGSSLVVALAGLIWGLVYAMINAYTAALVPWGFSIFSLLSAIHYLKTRNINTLRRIQLLLILVAPFILMIIMGGFHTGSVVFLWSLMAPLGALLYYRPSNAPRWLGAYLVLLLVSGILQMLRPVQFDLTDGFIISFYVMNIGIVSLIVFMLLYHFVRGKNRAMELLRQEQKKSERLLLNVLPKEIAPILKEGKEIIAEQYPSASVMFADIVGFTEMTAQLKPTEMVEILNEIFTYFDRLVSRYGLEKIRTIGDNYMVAAGVPVPRKDHAIALCSMAVDLCLFIQEMPPYHGTKINFRVGINSGQLVAGVIGRHKFHYDIWGDTVNTASRMESTGEPGRIQITEATYELVQPHFYCIPRGTIVVKGKGQMKTWYLENRKVI